MVGPKYLDQSGLTYAFQKIKSAVLTESLEREAMSASFALDRTVLSSSFANTLTSHSSELTSLSRSLDECYRSGSSGDFQLLSVESDASISGNVYVGGDLTVFGEINYTSEEALRIRDKYIILASGSYTPAQADGGGIYIDGANVTMSYDSSADALFINKPLNVTYVKGNLDGTASLALTASYVDEDSIFVRSILELYNTVTTETGSTVQAAEMYLYCGPKKTFRICDIITPEDIQLLLPSSSLSFDYEHTIIFKNRTASTVTVYPPKNCFAVSTIEGKTISRSFNGGAADDKPVEIGGLDGGKADSTYGDDEYSPHYVLDPWKAILMTYYVDSNESVVITSVVEVQKVS